VNRHEDSNAQGNFANGVELLGQYLRSGDAEALDQAVDQLQRAVDGSAVDHPDRSQFLLHLSFALVTRFEQVGSAVDLDVNKVPSAMPASSAIFDVDAPSPSSAIALVAALKIAARLLPLFGLAIVPLS
jgi:hypothetical protein